MQGDFKKLGINLVGVSYDSASVLKAFSEKEKVSYPLLSDPKSEIIRAFDVFNDEYNKEHKWHGVPHPYVFLVSSQGRITAKFSKQGYRARPKATDILKFIETMQNKGDAGDAK